ncbi:MAG: ImmA/IrrE family metallo-endopeptidase [Cetobacterium sp.]
MCISKSRREEIRNLAKAVAYIVSNKTYPVDLSKIVEKFGLKLYEVDLDKFYPGKNLSGILRVENKIKEIYINNAHPDTRSKFTIAHELGHFFLHGDILEETGRIISFRGNYQNMDKVIEKEADLFAAELLMPKEIMYQIIEIDSKNNLEYLSKYFGVSNVAMSRRIIELNEEK